MAGKRKLEEALQDQEQKTQEEKRDQEKEKEEEKTEPSQGSKKDEKKEDEKKDEKTDEEKKDEETEQSETWDGVSLFGEGEDWVPPENPWREASWERNTCPDYVHTPRATVWMVPEGYSLARGENGLEMFPQRERGPQF